MRTPVFLSASFLFAACAVERSHDATIAADASLQRGAAALAATPDPVIAQMLRSAFATHDQQRRVAIANLANVDTCAYKRQVVRIATHDVVDADGLVFQVPSVRRIDSSWTTGALEVTNRNLDLAIDGDGFFAVLRRDGSRGYTRAGSLAVNAEGRIVTGDGCAILPEITVPSDTLEISVDPEGRWSGRTAGSPECVTTFGSLTLHRFVNPEGLESVGDNVWRPTETSGAPFSGAPGTNGLGVVKQGFLERSNVQRNDELMNLQILERQREALAVVTRQFGIVVP